MRLGIFGGTFDPVHLGHLILAENCRDQARLDEVIWVPAGLPPHKIERPITAGEHRKRMIELAVAGNPAFRVHDLELRREGPSYSVDTVAELQAERPGHEWFFLIGADTVPDLPLWHETVRIARMATFLIVHRPGIALPPLDRLRGVLDDSALEAFYRHVVEVPPIGVSATDCRRRVAEGRSIRYLVPASVQAYILQHGLYRGAGTSAARF